MANGKPKNNLNFHLSGRIIAIAVIAPISIACFTLGYLVGKATTENSVQEIVISAPPDETTAEAEEVAIPSEITTNVSAVPIPSGESQDVNKIKSETIPDADEKAVPHVSGAKKPANDTVYSVQIAAFQNRRDAETMQSKFKSRGYTTYIFRTRTKDQKTIYKVRVGKFNDRAEAERLALKLKEIEGVSPFITSF